MPSASPIPIPINPSSPNSTPKSSIQLLSRNIDTVVLGNILFKTWFYSPYPDSVIFSAEAPNSCTPSKHTLDDDHVNGAHSAPSPSTSSASPAICPRLFVCPYCFRYSPHLAPYTSHLGRHHADEEQDPELFAVPDSSAKVYEYNGYAVWEVDGENEKLYCQNLSLFGKLFLEQKSVFFDTGGFLYYVLTYTPPETPPPLRKGRGKGRHSSTGALDHIGLKSQVLGFFSKENPSWDSNNLACILIFPPFQHRQLGKLLMSVSYKLSGWEWEGGVIGGPEKPLSVMGRRSYLRFWSERVARFMLGETADADGQTVFERKKEKRSGPKKEEMSVREIGERTGMLPEDVVAALGEMGVCEMVGPRKKVRRMTGTSDVAEAGDEEVVKMMVKRSMVKEWVERTGVELKDPVREEGFLGEWAMSEVEESRDKAGTEEGEESENAS